VRKKRKPVQIKSTGVIVSFIIFLPPLKALVDVFDIVSYLLYFISSRSSFFSTLPFAVADGLRYAKGSDYVLGLSHWWKHIDDVSPSVVLNLLLTLIFYSLPVILASG
jgi:hypothetical protein